MSLPLHRWILNPPRVVLFWLVFLVFEVGCYAYGWPAIDIASALSRDYRERRLRPAWNRLIATWGRAVSGMNRAINGVRIDVEGRVPEGRFIVVANHQSTADIPVLFEVFRDKNLKFVVKKELVRWIPAISRALRDGGFAVIDFTGPHRTVADLVSFARSVSAWDGTPVIYPEGRRTSDGSIAPFREAGIRILVLESGLPVVPVVIDGLWKARTALDFFLHLPDSRCRIRILDPIPPTDAVAGIEQLPQRLHASMQEALGRMRATAQGER